MAPITRSTVGGSSSKSAAVTILDNESVGWTTGRPFRSTRNPAYIRHVPHLPTKMSERIAKTSKQSSKSLKEFTNRRNQIIRDFLKEACAHPGTFGRVGSSEWNDRLLKRLQKKASSGWASLTEITMTDVKVWLKHAQFKKLAQKLKPDQPSSSSSSASISEDGGEDDGPLSLSSTSSPAEVITLNTPSFTFGSPDPNKNDGDGDGATGMANEQTSIADHEILSPAISTTIVQNHADNFFINDNESSSIPPRTTEPEELQQHDVPVDLEHVAQSLQTMQGQAKSLIDSFNKLSGIGYYNFPMDILRHQLQSVYTILNVGFQIDPANENNID